MKKFALIFIVSILILSIFVFVGCKDSSDNEENKTFLITISFDTNGIECTVPEDVSVEVSGNSIEFAPPIPEDAIKLEGYDLAWFLDAECINLFDANSLENKDLTLYLGYNPKTYSITYTNKDEFDFKGEFKDSYVFGEGVPLPNVNLGNGYYPNGNWYYNETEYFTTSVSESSIGDLTLTFKPNVIVYEITYVSGLPENVEMNNPNALKYDVTMGKIILLPATAEGKTFSHWEYRNVMSKPKKIEYIDFDLIMNGGMSFSIVAVWENNENSDL